MPKVWQPADANKFARWARKGVTVYTVADVARNLAPYEDSRLCSAHTADGESRITGSVMFGHMSAKALCQNFGPIYEQPPAGVRNLAGPAPQVAGPLGADYDGVLDEAELRGLEKQAAQTSDPRKRSPLGTWRP